MNVSQLLGSLDRGGPRPALIAAGVSLVGLALTGVVAFLVPVVHAGDAASLKAFADLNRPVLTPLAKLLAHTADAGPYAVAGAALALLALRRGEARLALIVVGVLIGGALTSELLKPLLADPSRGESFADFSVGGASWPSGHAMASMGLALCGVLVAPRRLRPAAAAAGTALAVGVSFSILMLGWHFPSDVLGGFLVAATWVSLGIAALRAGERPQAETPGVPARAPGRSQFAPVALAAAAAGGLAILVLVRPDAVASFASAHKSFVAGALAIAALAWTLASGLALALRR